MNEIEKIKSYSIVEDRKQINKRLIGSKEVDDIVSTIEVYKMDSILSFGCDISREISKSSDMILKGMNIDQFEHTDEILQALANVMGNVDIEELREKTVFFKKLFTNKERHLDKIVIKYHTIGEEIDKVYIQLRKYEVELGQYNKKLEQLFETNVKKYYELVKYILAGEQGCRELREYIVTRKIEMEDTKDVSIEFDLITLNQSLVALEQKVYDLKIVEQVAMQSIPMIQMMQLNYIKLMQKIKEAFIITLPIFKQTLAQAILLKKEAIQSEAIALLKEKKRQVIRAEAVSVLEKKKKQLISPEMVFRLKNKESSIPNTKDIGQQFVLNSQLDLGIYNEIGMLETTFQTIIDGIGKTKEMQEYTRKNWKEEQEKLKVIKQKFEKM